MERRAETWREREVDIGGESDGGRHGETSRDMERRGESNGERERER